MKSIASNYYRLMGQFGIVRDCYPAQKAEEMWTLCEANQHIMAGTPGVYSNCTLLDFKAYYPHIMRNELLPYGDVLTKKPKGKHCKFHKVLQSDGEIVYMWDEMYQLFEGFEILETYYMKLTDKYQKLGEYIIKKREQYPDRKDQFMIFGCFFYGRKQGYKYVENFFAGSYLYVKAYLVMEEMVQKLHRKGAKILNTATDSVLFSGEVEIPDVGYRYSLKHFELVEYRSQNNWTGYNNDKVEVEKHQGIHILKGGSC